MILMRQDFNNIKVLFSGIKNIEEMKSLPAKEIFDRDVCSFLNTLSDLIRKDPEARNYADIVTFGFFCRKASIEKLKQDYYQPCRIGRGVSFHIAPSNVPINFAYSMVAGLLAGNSCVVRTSTKSFEQTDILCRIIQSACDVEQTSIEKYIAIIQYERNEKINDYISSIADVRIIWGGDSTIEQLRKSKIPSRCVEVTFADRYSLCVLYAKDILKISEWKKVAQDFYNDTYLYDQNACSSPRLMYWIGENNEIEEAKKFFWNAIHQFVSEKYIIEPIIAVNKLTTDYRVAIEQTGIKIEQDIDNLFHRIHLKKLEKNLSDYSCPGGSFLEYSSKDLDDLSVIIDKKYQTLSYLGGNSKEITEWVIKKGISGIDRVVPMGKTADFALTWDGYNLIETMSRKISYQ